LISANAAFAGSYDYSEVARSILIAIAASYAALDLAGRVTAARGWARALWLAGGAIAMGIGIWAMHFKGMLAFRLPIAIAYHWPTVLLSLVVAALASAVALYVVSRPKMGRVQVFTGSLIMGGGIAAMHYIGMAAMRLAAACRFDVWVVTLSVVLAIVFSLTALLLAFDLREETRGTPLRKIGSAAVMGAAISAMHYTGMAAASFVSTAVPPDLSHAVSVSPLANNGLAIVTFLVLGAAIVTSSVDRQSEAAVRRLNEGLEQRVVERTVQLEAVNQALRKEIAERERAEEAVRQSEDRLRLVIDTTPALLYSARPDGDLDFFNKRWLEYLGLPLDQIIGWGWTSAIHPEDVDDLVRKWRRSLATGEPYEAEARVRRADGEYRWMLHRKVPARDDQGTIIKWYGSSVDIEDRRRAEDAVRRSEEHLRLVIDTAPAMIQSARPDGYDDFFNKHSLDYVGLSLDDMLGWGWTRVIHREDVDEMVSRWRSSLTTGKPFEAEMRVRRADGEYRWVLQRKVPLRDQAGNIVKWYCSSIDIEDRKRAEDAVRRSEEHLRLVIDTVPAMLHSARPDGYVDFFNKRWLEYAGVSLEDIRGWGWTNVMHPEDVENVVGKWRSSVATGKPFEAEARLRRVDGEYRLMLLRKVPLRDETGSIVKWYGSATDIEDRKRAEEELRQAEEHIRAILEYSPNWIFLKDTEGRYLLVNREIERVFGIGQEQIKGKTDSEIFPPERAAEYRANDLKVLRAGLTMEFEEIALLEDGPHTSIVHKFPLFDTHGNIYATGGVATDITERKRAEEARRESEEKFHQIADNIHEIFWMVDAATMQAIYVNPAFKQVTGRPLASLQEDPLSYREIIHPDDRARVLSRLDETRKTGRFEEEFRITCPDGTIRWVEVLGFPIRDAQGNTYRLAGVVQDITDNKLAEQSLHEAQAELARVSRAVTMGELVASIAHEVNQPLAAVVTTSNFALRQLASEKPNLQQVQEAITEIVEDATRISAVISQIRALLEKGAPERVELDINDVIQEVTMLVRNETALSQVQVRLDLADDLPLVVGDRVQLQQVLINLAMNGIDAMRTVNDRPRKLEIKSEKHADGVLVQVQDSGIGLDPERANRIFEPFFTTKPQGIGMGLSISRSIIESHGGRLRTVPRSPGAIFQFTPPTIGKSASENSAE
jgi:PAS domain S-box-containing protein